MRLSTLQFHTAGVNAILKQQAALSKTQQQIATGKRVQTAADDPTAAVQLQQLERLQAQQEQYAKNSVVLTNRLQLEEQALTDSTQLLQRVRDLVLQANNDSMTDADRQSTVAELRGRIAELQSIANRQDNQNEYLFAGSATASKPFVRSALGAMEYHGDTGTRSVQVDTSVALRDGDPGLQVFAGTRQGNGTFVAAVNSANTGAGSIDTGTVVDAASWVPDNYQIRFTAPGAWQVTDSGNVVVASGSFSPGGSINFRGVQVTIEGQPAAGDRFAISPAGTTDVFATLDALLASLTGSGGGQVARARLHSELGAALLQIDQSLEQLSGVRSEVGARLSSIDDIAATRDGRLADIATSMSQLRDLDYAAAVSRMNQQLVGLQAAQQSFSMISRLSLFDYL